MEKKRSVLIVDDDPNFLGILGRMIQNIGFHPISAENGQAGLDFLKNNPEICCVFTDYKMPSMDGPALIKKIRKIKELKDLPIYILSGAVSLKKAGDLLDRGVKGFMEKPIFQDDIKNILEQVTGPSAKETPPANPAGEASEQ
ncbi:response regulator [Fibrobacterota bacterium]